MMCFSTCIIFASNGSQRQAISELLARRRQAGLYPREIEFLVLSDPEQGRIGSGGAAVAAASAVAQSLRTGKSVLLINAGGESRRMPAYAPEGKLFAPLPVSSSVLFSPVLLDLQLSFFLSYPWNPGEMLVTSGDVYVDFDVDSIPGERGDVYGFAKAADLELGSRHGVYKFDRNRTRVLDYFQKKPAVFLSDHALLEGTRLCALDTGIVGFSQKSIQSLLHLGRAKAEDGTTVLSKLETGGLSIDLYLEILTACVPDLAFGEFRSRVSPTSHLSTGSLTAIYDSFHATTLSAWVTKRTRFLHFGSLSDHVTSCHELASQGIQPFYVSENAELVPFRQRTVLICNSRDSTCEPGAASGPVLLDGCTDTFISCARGGNIFVGLSDRKVDFEVKEGVCIDEREIASGIYLLVYSAQDSWKPVQTLEELIFCGFSMERWLSERGLGPGDIFGSGEAGPDIKGPFDLYDARLFSAGMDIKFLEGYLFAGKVDAAWSSTFRAQPRLSLREITARDSPTEREKRRCAIRASILRAEVLSGHGWTSIPEGDFLKCFTRSDSVRLQALAADVDDDLVRIYRSRLLRSLGAAQGRGDSIEDLRIEYLAPPEQSRDLHRDVKLDQIVWARSPVRLDLAGGWTDTPPFTLREGGEVVNLAVDLNGQPPIQAFCRAIPERRIILHSIDTGSHEEIADFSDLEDYRNPRSTFALPKAALCLLGMTRERTRIPLLAQLLSKIGCGMEISLLSAVPKGSGLGTSSILGATALAAVERFFGIPFDVNEISSKVLLMEQMLTTGGGWQDQLGGIIGGVKYLSSRPGLKPQPLVHQLDPFLVQAPRYSSHFTLYYTGITRLAKNILQEVVDKANSMEPAYLYTLRYLKLLARIARDSFSLRKIALLSSVLNESWEANKRIHASTTNVEVESLLERVRGLYAGMKLLGAGGGGYALFLSRSERDAAALRERLSRHEDDRARLVDMAINTDGLCVTVS